MHHKPQFVSERVVPEAGGFDTSGMARGEPSVPTTFVWREQRYRVAQTLAKRRTMGEDRGDSYVRRHYYDIETDDKLCMSLYFERNPSDRGKRKVWWLYTVTFPDPVIETPRLWLRRWTYADRDAFRLMTADAQTMKFLPDNTPLSDQQADEALAKTIQRYEVGFGDWAIENRANGEIMGESGLTMLPRHTIPLADDEVEIGWMLGSPFWGHGFALEAASAVKDYAFSAARLGRLVALVDPRNERSIKLALKLGMTPAGVGTHHGPEMLKFALEQPVAAR
jgi:RimJ/RimL family protein N-acetyltransferase